MIDGKTVACLGGTFNRLHAGHRLLLKTAFEIADSVFVGVTSDALVRRLRGARAQEVRPYAEREALVRRLLEGYAGDRWTVASLDDPYTPVRREEFDAIVVSPETRKTAEEINALRALRGYASIKIVEVAWILAFDGKPISSTRILRGEIDEDGRPVAPPAAPKRRSTARPRSKRRAAKRPSGKKAAAKPSRARSKARKGSRAGGPRSRR